MAINEAAWEIAGNHVDFRGTFRMENTLAMKSVCS